MGPYKKAWGGHVYKLREESIDVEESQRVTDFYTGAARFERRGECIPAALSPRRGKTRVRVYRYRTAGGKQTVNLRRISCRGSRTGTRSPAGSGGWSRRW